MNDHDLFAYPQSSELPISGKLPDFSEGKPAVLLKCGVSQSIQQSSSQGQRRVNPPHWTKLSPNQNLHEFAIVMGNPQSMGGLFHGKSHRDRG